MALNSLKPPKGATQKPKRVGRGPGSGLAKTAGRGSKGQKSRAGSSVRPGFEGGQMPLHRRLPKRGFTNIFKTEYAIVNVGKLDRFKEGMRVDAKQLLERGLVRNDRLPVKVLGHGDLKKSLTVVAHKFSKSAAEKIALAGGRVEQATAEPTPSQSPKTAAP
ncbi:MAG: 50S ribosomal protein L15 [Acidobacteria bacterium]|nr:50S ribosomal protein L15 [Acidobacteriota bacterium]